jgi:hypothetical protein
MGRIVPLVAAIVVLAAATAGAQVQTHGSEVFPGKYQASIEPIGGQVGFTSRSPTGYKLFADFAGNVAGAGFGSIWVGGQLDYSFGMSACYVVDCGADAALWVYVMLTFEKLIPIPLVPFARAGVGADLLLYSGLAYAIPVHIGGGAHYYLLKWLGIGLETNVTLGPGLYPQGAGTLFYGHWDAGMGVRFNF